MLLPLAPAKVPGLQAAQDPECPARPGEHEVQEALPEEVVSDPPGQVVQEVARPLLKVPAGQALQPELPLEGA